MNMSTALNNAVSGLTATSRGVSVVTDNIANALTPGYVRRSLELSTSAITGHGVQVTGVVRAYNPVLTANRRAADADLAYASALSDFRTGLENMVGTADDQTSIAGRLATLESNLITAASLPGSATRLDQVALSAADLVDRINAAAQGLREMRSEADRDIGKQVDALNQALQDIQELNDKIPAIRNSGGDINALLDQRQLLIDQLNEIIPVNVLPRENDRVSIYSDGGLILLEGPAVELTFSTTGETMPHMTINNGLLSGLQANGRPVRTLGDDAQIRGGSLAAQFKIRDELAVAAQTELDALARDLIERFETPGLDPTVAATDPGLFTDSGLRFDATAPPGLSLRLSLNATIDLRNGGQSWHLRDGLGAAAPGDPGEARQISAFADALNLARALPGSPFGAGTLRATEVADALLSSVGANAHTAATRQTFAAVAQQEMQRIEAERGVDTDAELQRMMQIEQSYAANARMISVIDELMETLLRI